MKHKVMVTDQGKVVIDEIKEGCKYYDGINIGTAFTNNAGFYKDCDKLIATVNHSISLDVPMVIVKDEVEKLAIDYDKSKFRNFKREHTTTEFYETAIDGIIAGYKAAQQKGVYSEEDLIGFSKWIEKEELPFEDGSFVKYFNGKDNYLTVSQVMQMYIQSLKQEYIELEMEYLSNDGNWKDVLLPSEWEIDTKTRIKTNRVDGQLMAYLKS